MSLLSVTVKKARYVGAQASQFNTYVTLKLQNVKSTTVTVKGATPCWGQDFLFETNDQNTGLLIEVWSKGMIWDRAMGYHWLPLQTVQYSNEEGNGQWLSLDAELVMRDGEVVGTKMATGHSLLVDCRFELPFDAENIEASDLQRKLEMLNNIMDQEARAEQARRQMQYFGHSYSNHFDNEISAGYSEDSDYTSDLNYPVGQHANSSASQFMHVAGQIGTPQRSLEASRENSYERDDNQPSQHHLAQPMHINQHHLSPGSRRKLRYSPNNTENYGVYGGTPNPSNFVDYSVDEPLGYNSQPRRKDFYSQDTWVSCESSFYKSVDSMEAGYSVETQYYENQTTAMKAGRRPSLERQATSYDDSTYYGDNSGYQIAPDVTEVNYMISSNSFNQNQSCDEFVDSLSYPFQEERYGQDEEDRQWDSGGTTSYYQNSIPTKIGKKLPTIPIHNTTVTSTKRSLPSWVQQDEGYMGEITSVEPYNSRPIVTPGGRRKMPQIPTKRSFSRQSSQNDELGYRTPEFPTHRGASLPPTPTKTPSKSYLAKFQATTANKPFNSLPPTPGRQLPKPKVSSRSEKAKLHSMTRTTSADYGDNSSNFNNYYIRPGAASVRDEYKGYNEDYNYAYQSTDNLPEDVDDVARNANGYYDNYYSVTDGSNETFYDPTSALQPAANKKPMRDVTNVFQQQNTDSLESRDDELKDSSFETVVSSISSTAANQKNLISYNHSEYSSTYSTAGESIFRNTTPMVVPQMLDSTPQYTNKTQGDQKQAIISIATGTQPSVTVAQVHNQTQNHQNTTTSFVRGQLKQQVSVESPRGYLTQQKSVDQVSYGYQPQQDQMYQQSQGQGQAGVISEFIDEFDEYRDGNKGRLEAQDSVESYVEEDVAPVNDIVRQPSYTLKQQKHDSPQSVIHEELYEDEQANDLRRGSSQITVVDPYHPRSSISAPTTERLSDADQYAPSVRVEQQQSLDENYSRKTSLAESIGNQRRSSMRHSPTPPEHHEDIPEEIPIIDEEAHEKKSVSFEEEDEEAKQQRPQVTAQQRWLWAYNKIIMQINVFWV